MPHDYNHTFNDYLEEHGDYLEMQYNNKDVA